MTYKKMRNRKLSRYTEHLLLAKNIVKIAEFMHKNVNTLDTYFSTEDMNSISKLSEEDIKSLQAADAGLSRSIIPSLQEEEIETVHTGFMDKVYHYLSGEKVETKVKNEETGEEETVLEDVRTRVAIFRTPDDAQYKRQCQYVLVGSKLSNIVFAPVNSGEYQFLWFGAHEPIKKNMKLKDFDQYSTEQNLNFECWLFRSMSPDIEILMSYLEKYHCPGIDIDPNDVPMLLQRFGLEAATVQDIEELP